MNGFDWPGLLRVGLGQLGRKPDEFWALTPSELRRMLGQDAGDAPMGRAGLMALMERFPDASRSQETEK